MSAFPKLCPLPNTAQKLMFTVIRLCTNLDVAIHREKVSIFFQFRCTEEQETYNYHISKKNYLIVRWEVLLTNKSQSQWTYLRNKRQIRQLMKCQKMKCSRAWDKKKYESLTGIEPMVSQTPISFYLASNLPSLIILSSCCCQRKNCVVEN